MVWIEKTGPDTYEEEHHIGDHRIKIYRGGERRSWTEWRSSADCSRKRR